MEKEIDGVIKERRALVAQLNILQERYNQNEYDMENIAKIMQIKEQISRLTKKLDVLTFKDKERE